MTLPTATSPPFEFGGSPALSVALGIVALLSLLLFVIVRRDATLLYFSTACLLAASFPQLPQETVRGWPGSLREFASASVLPLAVTGFALALVASVQRMFATQPAAVRHALVPVLILAGWESSLVYASQGLLGRSIGLCAGVAGWFLFRRRRGCGWVYLGLGASWLVTSLAQRSLVSATFAPVLAVLMTGTAVAQLIALRLSLQASAQARLTATRLELELLKKNIQPHFLINTLTALTEAIETTPQLAVRMIDSLAEEFRLLVAISARPTVPLELEVDLCRAHLNVMSLRHNLPCTLSVASSPEEIVIPPGVLHTVIENGFTHQIIQPDDAEFQLTVECAPGETRLVLVNPGSPRPRPKGNTTGGGTGLRYIRARLEEAFPGRWRLTGRVLASGHYETAFVIEVESK